jgi:hypothetical protein
MISSRVRTRFRLHVLKCPECTRELIELRNAQTGALIGNEVPRPRNWRWAGIAAGLLCCLAIGSVAYWRLHSSSSSTARLPATPVRSP